MATCIKCKNTYLSDEEDYYCDNCNTIRLDIAKAIDKKFEGRTKESPPSFDERMKEFETIKGIPVINMPKRGK